MKALRGYKKIELDQMFYELFCDLLAVREQFFPVVVENPTPLKDDLINGAYNIADLEDELFGCVHDLSTKVQQSKTRGAELTFALHPDQRER